MWNKFITFQSHGYHSFHLQYLDNVSQLRPSDLRVQNLVSNNQTSENILHPGYIKSDGPIANDASNRKTNLLRTAADIVMG